MTAMLRELAAPVRGEVAAFAVRMERELKENNHKPGWKGDSIASLTARVCEETRELERAVAELDRQIIWREARHDAENGNGWSRLNPVTRKREIGVGYREMEGEQRETQLDRIISEAADVANMAMMVADVAAALRAHAGDE